TDDYSRFSWVFFLASKDETTPVFKTFILGLKNLLSLKVKVTRCDNRTEFKNSDLNQFCGLKGIKREFNVPRTPEQNGIAERKNRTLIEAAKTLLADSLLPIPFWAEAVNTACYVQNRVLVTKPHNKTPYELLHSRLPSIGFMRPFGCPVTILNTLDHLGKFQGKVDEGFLFGYSVCSKAFRVFNSRTRIVQETLHVNFMENKPNVASSGPAWLFDIDREEVTHTYVLFPLLSDGFTNSQNKNKDALVDGKEHDDDIQMYVSPDIHSSSSGAQTRKQADKTENKDKVKNPVVTITGFRDLNAELKECTNNSSNGVNAASSSVSTAGHNFINITNNFSATGPSNTAASPTFANSSSQDASISSHVSDMPNLEDLTHSDDASDVGVEDDINNLESIISVSPIPITRIHKDHSTSQIIGDLSLTTQTRRMARAVRDQASTPIDAEKPLLKDSDGEDVDAHTYRSMLGSLMYLTSSGPDIMFAEKPHLGLWYPKDSPVDLVAYLDSDYDVVATSSTEAEYVAAASGCAQGLWIQNQLLDYGYLRNMVIEIVVLNILSDALPITTNGVQLTMSNPQERADSP
nr:retrovirus-related Pol polyprotein from transposon TNT 1-94 [Tanacetum cinerariifolium]